MKKERGSHFLGVAILSLVLVTFAIFTINVAKDNSQITGKLVEGEGSGLVAYYDFDSKNILYDNSTNRNPLINIGTSYATGKIGGARYLDGTGNMRAKSIEAQKINGAITISAWIFPNEVNGYRTIVWKGDNNNANYYFSQRYDDLAFGFVKKGGIFEAKNPEQSYLTENEWHQVTVTLDEPSGEVKFYHNGEEIYSGKMDEKMPGNIGGEFSLGKRNGFNDQYFKGRLDEFRLYNRVLSASEIRELYNFGMKIGSQEESRQENPKVCEEKWICDNWSECNSETGVQVRTCNDENNCGTYVKKPEEQRTCNSDESENTETNQNNWINYILVGILVLIIIFVVFSRRKSKNIIKKS